MSVTEQLGDIAYELPPGFSLATPLEVDPQTLEIAIWDSLYSHAECTEGQGVHNPDVVHAIEAPDPDQPEPVFLIDLDKGRAVVLPELGVNGIKKALDRALAS